MFENVSSNMVKQGKHRFPHKTPEHLSCNPKPVSPIWATPCPSGSYMCSLPEKLAVEFVENTVSTLAVKRWCSRGAYLWLPPDTKHSQRAVIPCVWWNHSPACQSTA